MSGVELKVSDHRVLLPIHAQPGSRRNQISGVHDGRLKIAVTQAPEGGKANREILAAIAEAFGLSKSQIELVSGLKSSRKVFAITGLDIDAVEQQIQNLLS
ncbi:DUF167 domain-containing protein [Planctomicrobium sp. SH668]|uniref:DUF167 domain-containing protein n=1 Tax=Planctomicrobium sp. SH668 TaxID=3448126 RepID=UPI003F5CAA2C